MDTHFLLFNIIYLIFYFGHQECSADDVQCPINYTSTNAIKRLKQSVFCKYDRMIRPVRQHNDTVNVQLLLVLKRIDFNDKTDTLTMYSLFVLKWKDYHLLWDPSKFDDIKKLRVGSYSIWTPDLGVHSSFDQTSFSPYLRSTICTVDPEGNVRCVPPYTHTSSCSADLTRWPYDIHTCKLIIGSWTHNGELVNVSLVESRVYLDDYNANREWYLLSLKSYRLENRYDLPNDTYHTYPTVTLEFTLQRHSGSYAAIVVLPAVILMFLTLTSFWMTAENSERLTLILIDLFSHFLFLQYLGSILPPNSDGTPLLVTFFRDSMFLTTMALYTTLIVRGLRNTQMNLPMWVSGISARVYQNRLGQILVFHNLNPKSAAVVSETSGNESTTFVDGALATNGWDTFTILLEFVCFSIVLFIYIILLIGFIP